MEWGIRSRNVMESKSIKHSVAFVIYNQDHTKILVVRRPLDDDNLPNIWGLPAGSLKENETFEGAVIRSAKDKLGVEVRIVKLISEGEIERNRHILHMKEFEIEIQEGDILVPQSVSGVTQYSEWKWGQPGDLIEAAQKDSLCSRLYLESVKVNW
ncbi:MAG: NUDIX hydrolase [bacterium]|nr:NUDIX hydrolase [bacterium]